MNILVQKMYIFACAQLPEHNTERPWKRVFLATLVPSVRSNWLSLQVLCLLIIMESMQPGVDRVYI